MRNPSKNSDFGQFALDTDRRALFCAGEAVRLSPKEYQVLCLLAVRAGKAVSRKAIMVEVWPDTVVGDTSLARCISALRRHLGPDAIEVVPKFGYRLAVNLGPKPLPGAGENGSSEAWKETPAHLSESKPSSDSLAVPPPDDMAAEQTTRHAPRRRWLWVSFGSGVAVLLLCAAASPLQRVLPLGRPASTWTDAQTGLEWQRQDNGYGKPPRQADVTRDEALADCAALRLAGHADWRLPNIAELQTLYDTSQSLPGTWVSRPVYWHVKGNLALSGGETASDVTWLTDVTPAGLEQSFDFSFGRRNYDPPDFRADHRVLCVRKSR